MDYWFTPIFCAIQREYGNPRWYPCLLMAKEASKFSPSLNSTIACIAGGIAQAFYKEIPSEIISKARNMLPKKFLIIIDEFNRVSFA